MKGVAQPRNIAVAGDVLAVAWQDGHESYFPVADLRRDCPCATCRAAAGAKPAPASALRVLRSAEPPAVVGLRQVGSYAIQLSWSDGHDTGIYAFDALRAACPCVDCRGRGG
ncbi:MAG TPA: DUF971 domain-containing protein [Candidatus Polarisedimenticolaceae bacterium]|nr:DUF971 domain-containing protein [Candidatus Polarisedimenticolaceae bacterium]